MGFQNGRRSCKSFPFSLQFSLLGLINGLTCSFPEQHFSMFCCFNLPALGEVQKRSFLKEGRREAQRPVEGALTQALNGPYSEEKHIEIYKETPASSYLHLRKMQEAPTYKVTSKHMFIYCSV